MKSKHLLMVSSLISTLTMAVWWNIISPSFVSVAMINKCLIANRGEIALRILSTCKKMGIQTVVAYSLCDKESPAVKLADESVCIGPDVAALSYMNMDHLCEAAMLTHCDALHPGYGFLSESATFAKRVEDCGLIFIGPDSTVLQRISHKNSLKKIVSSLSIPVIEGDFNSIDNMESALLSAALIGYPLIVKPAVGGGGRGVCIVNQEHELETVLKRLQSQGYLALTLEKYIAESRHIEVQILADQHQNVVHLSSRNCTLQSHFQKFIEEAPFSLIDPMTHRLVLDYALMIAKHIHLNNVATFEFLLDSDDKVYFMEINPRIQVEHPLSEMITGIDIVEQQILAANGIPISFKQEDIQINGYAIECRINAQDDKNGLLPSSGVITNVKFPKLDHVRIDTALFEGYCVPVHYDSLIAKVIGWGNTREQALLHLKEALNQTSIEGMGTNLDFLRYTLHGDGFTKGNYTSELFEHTFAQWQDKDKNQQNSISVCPQCQHPLLSKQLSEHQNVCEYCGHHFRLSATRRVADLMDSDSFVEIDAHAQSTKYNAFLGYEEKLKIAKTATGLNEAVICGLGKLGGHTVCIAVLDASFMMGSMGHVVGDKITRLIETALNMSCPLIIICASGGARMQEGIISLMQMAKTAAALNRFDQTGGLTISVFTDPTTGGVTASFAMLADILISEPKALIGFAGKRVIEKTIKETLPEEFQTAEYLLEHGFLDMIVDRRNLKKTLSNLLNMHRRESYE
ncbi:MAG: acetyl-CoA carboxylase, carboxyltransferase subunit beta [Erysipelotrichaceae bacterium]|nr:acetyl-CoA carboxylase, carboxyltransferase subunit beta [Erysipelotrichaceae bacterium]